jgi:hypothetical protein
LINGGNIKMRNIKFRAVLVFLIILLFVGTSVTSVTNGGIEKNNNISKNKVCNNYFTSTNSLLAYWSFDEGTGNVAYDYSGHDYHGSIVGASWTTGHSGSALDFNGYSDYVNLDAHSQDLGFNKTDDYKISVWIKSTSTNEGMIYEISNPNYEFPVFYLKWNSDGILNAYVSSTTTCWVEVYSNENYSDGQWHYIECIYHGSESEPTMELYVDEELVDSDTDYLCPMYAEQFDKTKIGKTSYDSPDNYFDGVVDEVKVYKKPEGNQPPNSPSISGPTTGTVGEEYSYIFKTTDPDGENVFYWIDWGDNYNTSWIGPYNSNQEISLDHIWSEEGTYLISAKAKDEFDQSEWSSSWVTIENQDPNAPSITGPPKGKAGTLYDYYFKSTDPDGHDVQYFIDWGDGDTEWTDFVSSGTEVKVSHTWSNRDTYVIKAKAKDAFDAESDLTTLSVTMPRNRATYNSLFLRFFEQFPTLQKMLFLIK